MPPLNSVASNYCPHCLSPLQPMTIHFGGKTYNMGYEPCHCEGAEKERIQRLREEAEREAQDAKRKAERTLRKSGIPKRYWGVKCVDGWEDGAYIVGSVGVGKTHMAAGMALKALNDGAKVRFLAGGDFLGRLRSSFGSEESEDAIIDSLSRCDLLILDDLGKDKPTDWACSMLYRLINARYCDESPTIVTSQYEKEELYRRLATGDKDTAEAIVSRLVEMCPRIHLDGKDRRLHG